MDRSDWALLLAARPTRDTTIGQIAQVYATTPADVGTPERMIRTAAKLGVSSRTLYRWAATYPGLRAALGVGPGGRQRVAA